MDRETNIFLEPQIPFLYCNFSGSTQKHVTENEDPTYGIWIPALFPWAVAFYCIEAIFLCARTIIHRGTRQSRRKKNAIDRKIPVLGRNTLVPVGFSFLCRVQPEECRDSEGAPEITRA